MTIRCVADFLRGKNQRVRLLLSIAVAEAACDKEGKEQSPPHLVFTEKLLGDLRRW
jgi:hypothetical protein